MSDGRFQHFLTQQTHALQASLEEQDFIATVETIDAAYVSVRDTGSASAMFARLCLLCHRSLFAAASLIGQQQGDDSAAISRRALEIAKLALAIKVDPENAEKWTSYEQRVARWAARRSGEKPGFFAVRYSGLEHNPLSERLSLLIGILSDQAVHFTPEFFSQVRFTFETVGGVQRMYTNYFVDDAVATARHVLGLAIFHKAILETFDSCFDGGFSQVPEYVNAMNCLRQLGMTIHRKHGFALPPDE